MEQQSVNETTIQAGQNAQPAQAAPAAQAVRRPPANDEIDLVEVFYLFWGHAWQIILCLILGAAAAFGVTKFLKTPR